MGGRVALIEASNLGGTCVNRGCIPSKVWLCAATLKYWIERADEFGLKADYNGLDLKTLVDRKDEVGLASMFASFGCDTTLVVPDRRILPREDSEISQRLAQALREQGLTIVSNLVPRGLWTNPEAAVVGLTEEQAEKEGYDMKIGDFPYPVNGMAMLRGQVDDGIKIILEAEDNEIIGVHIVDAGATDS